MAGIFYRNTGGGLETLTKTEYTAVTPQTKTLYIKSGNGNPVRYGLTSDVSASNYSPKIPTSTATYYIARQSTYWTESETSRTYTDTIDYTDTATEESTQASTKESWYYNNAVIETSSSTSTNMTGAPNDYVFPVYAFTSSDIGGLRYRTLTLTATRYYSNGKYYYFSTTDSTTTHSCTANSLTYKFLSHAYSQGSTYNQMNPPAENYWYNNPTNNIKYSYAAGYTVSGAKTTATSYYISAKMSASMLHHDNAEKPTGIAGTYRYGGGYTHKSSTSRTHYSRSYTGTSSSYVRGVSYSNGNTGVYPGDAIGASIFTKLSNRANSVSYSSSVLYTTTTASKTYNSYTLSKSAVGISNYATTTNGNWTGYGWVYVSTFTVSRSTIKNSCKTNGSKWAKSDKYLPINDSYYWYSWTNSISRSSISYGYASIFTRSASAYVTTARTYTSRSSNYTKTNTVTKTVTITETVTATEYGPDPYIATSDNCNV